MEDKKKYKLDVEFTALVLIDIAYKRCLINKATYQNIMKEYSKKYGLERAAN